MATTIASARRERYTGPMRFYFDYVSPYAYIAWRQVRAVAFRHSRRLEPVPVLFGALLGAFGTKGPAEVPAKRRHLLRDVHWKAKRVGLPFVLPPSHPFNPILALRVSSLAMDIDTRSTLVDSLFDAAWGTGRGVDEPALVARAATEAGLDGEACVRGASEPEVKVRLRAETDGAIAAGVFGVPTVVVDGELFWGVDSLEALDDFLAGRGTVPADLRTDWERLPASVTRGA